MSAAPKLPVHTASNSGRTWTPACSTNRGAIVGRFDARGWHAASARSQRRPPRPIVGSLPLPLAS
jgi:hypothetical protein